MIYQQYMYSYPHKTSYEKIKKLNISKELNNKVESLYIHIPFCQSKCGYCNLFSIANSKQEILDSYLNAIKRQSFQFKNILKKEFINLNSLILGGGTPLVLSKSQLDKIFQLAINDFNFDFKSKFFAIETSPNQTDLEILKFLKEFNLNRISIGIQSFVEKELESLQRFHNFKSCISSLEKIKSLDFDILNIDLIYGIPNQTIESLIFSLKKTLYFSPEEIFIYPLYQKPNTRIFNKFEIDEKLQYKMYFKTKEFLTENGYHQISMRRFVKKKPEFLGSCGFENMLSLGCGARSYLDNIHFCETYTSKSSECLNQLMQFNEKTNFLENISFFNLNIYEQKRRFVIKNLLHIFGFNILEYNSKFSGDFFEDFPILNEWIEKNWVIFKNNHIKLTDLGLSLSDYIGPMLISKNVLKKMENFYDASLL